MRELLPELNQTLEQGVLASIAPSSRRAAPRRRRPGRRCSSSPTADRSARSAAAASRPRSSAGPRDTRRRGEPKTEVLTFCLDDNYGWDDGLICGGRMTILADPLCRRTDAGNGRALTTNIFAASSRPASAAPRPSSSRPDRCTDRQPLSVRRGRPADRSTRCRAACRTSSRKD